MSAVKVFHRKTKKGSIIKVVREHYLRDDIHCGRDSCADCRPFKLPVDNRFAPRAYLSDRPRADISSLCRSAHYVIPDFGVLEHQSDVLVDENFGTDVILMQTVWDEVKRNISVLTKIKQSMAEKRFYVFLNEYNKETFSERVFGETIAEYRQRLLVSGAEWLQNHFKSCDIKVVFVVNYRNIKLKTKNIVCSPFDEYVKSLKNSINLVDKLADMSSTGEYEKGLKPLYDEYLPLEVVQSGIRSGKYFQGKYFSNRLNYLEGMVPITRNGEEINIVIQGSKAINRSLHEDIVAIEVLPESEWKAKSNIVLTVEEGVEDKGEIEEEREEKMILGEEDNKQNVKQPMGKIVSIIRRKLRQSCGVLRPRNENINVSSTSNRYLFVPFDRSLPMVRIETRQYEQIKGQRIVVAIDNWLIDSKYPKGHYIRSVGPIGDKKTETEVILLEKDVPYIQFSREVMNCLPKEGKDWKLREEDFVNRIDLRNEAICSVDPPGCTDIDDALHCKDIGNGIYEVGVHIADVSHFIKPNTPLDKEASNRGTSVYLVGQRIDMIPTLLSSDLCSLHQDVERLTFSVIWLIDAKTAEIKSSKFTKSVIKSRGAMTYAEAQMRIDSPNMIDDVTQGLRRLLAISKILKRKRLEAGALVLASANEIKFLEIDSETHENVFEIQAKQVLDTNSMIEEFMLLANIAVAQKINEVFPELSLLRRHPKPSKTNFDELINVGKALGVDIDVTDGKTLSRSLDSVRDPNNPYKNLLLRMTTTRMMSQAVYFCSGALTGTDDSFDHYGLATPIYTHFTSPIRRYADLMVHRLLSHVIEYEALDASLLNKRYMTAICDHINIRNKNAREASRESNNLHSLLYIKERSGGQPLEEDGYIMNIKKNAFQIFLPHLALEVSYFMNKTSTDWLYDNKELTQEYLPRNHKFRHFDPLRVRLSISDNNVSLRQRLVVDIIKPFDIEMVTNKSSNKRQKT